MKRIARRSVGTVLMANGVAVAGLTSIGGIEETTETIDVTTLDSDGGSREFIAGFSSPGEVSLEGFLLVDETGLEAGQAVMKQLKDSGDRGSFDIVFPKKVAAWRFQGIITTFGTSFALEDAISFTSQITVSGKPELVFGAAATGLSSAAAAAVETDKKSKGDKS